MITLAHAVLRKIRMVFDPIRWLTGALGFSIYSGDRNSPGLILIQIDGLSHAHFYKAMDEGYLPFLKQLKEKERYRDWHHYSGIPSSTPSIQGELFYGVKQCVPAFKFKDSKSGKVLIFYDSDAAREIETRLQGQGQGLLTGGSSYCNIFRGGAEENAHFCVASVGWKAFVRALNPLTLSFFILVNFFSILRVFVYMIVEFFLAVFDSIRGALGGYGFRDEIKFILSRLIATVALREAAVLGSKLDLIRGLPVIHLNFFGYDDQAHRRGPGSRFAYWALPGIDAAIRKIWKAAQNSVTRDYEVWIYSDHGQEEVIPYVVENGTNADEAIINVLRRKMPGEEFELGESGMRRDEGCHTSCYSPRINKMPEVANCPVGNKIFVTVQGPVGFVYAHRALTDREKDSMACALVQEAHIPAVLTVIEGKVYGYSPSGKFLLPEEASRLVGENHPYPQEVAQDLESLALHPDAGDFVIMGWRQEKKSISFPNEYGSHAGPGPGETDGFAFFSKDIRVQSQDKKYLRPMELRETALGYLKGDRKIFHTAGTVKPYGLTLRVLTYNVHSCVGMDGQLSPERIARVIARHEPDIIALQELDSGRLRTKGTDQAKMIAGLLDMEHHFHPVRSVEEELYGNAVLSRYPLKVIRAAGLPRLVGHKYFEPRGALWVEVQFGKRRIQLLTTHLSFWAPEQRKQADHLCGTDWLSSPECSGPVILCGDFNAVPNSQVCRRVENRLQDAQKKLESHKPLNTWFGHFPLGRIDHIFVSQGVEVLKIEVPSSSLEKMASDHLPLIAELCISGSEPGFCSD